MPLKGRTCLFFTPGLLPAWICLTAGVDDVFTPCSFVCMQTESGGTSEISVRAVPFALLLNVPTCCLRLQNDADLKEEKFYAYSYLWQNAQVGE